MKLKPSQNTQSVVLGQTPTSEACIDGVPVKALLDTGLPISIVSLEFFLKACVHSRKPSDSPEEWGKVVKERLQQPTVILRSYGSGELNFVSQVKCCIRRDKFEVETILQVQKGVPVDLLIGTDILTQLGFMFSRIESDGKPTYLLLRDGSAKAEVESITDGSTNMGSHTFSATTNKGDPNVPEAVNIAEVKLI